MARPVVLDVDTGADDALAILFALIHPDLELLGISCVAGGRPLDQVLANTAKVLDAAGASDIPFAGGAGRPLVQRGPRYESQDDGLRGVDLPESAREPSPLGAVELLRRLIMSATSPVTVVGLGPHTNLALLLMQHPEVGRRIERIVVMGGAVAGGNITPLAELNVWQDPEAADLVMDSEIATTMYGLNVLSRLVLDQPTARRLASSRHPAQRLAGQLLSREVLARNGAPTSYLGLVGSAGGLVMLTDPEKFVVRSYPVRVNLDGMGRGQTVVDRRPVTPGPAGTDENPWPTVGVVLDLDVTAVAQVFVGALDQYSKAPGQVG